MTVRKPAAPPTKELPIHPLSKYYEYSKLSQYEGLRGKLRCRAPTTYVGVEIELERVNMNYNHPSSWNSTTDGSLKLDGREFTTVPIRFCYLEQELTRLFACFSKPPLVSSRCSIHVHLNVRDMTHQELYRFMLLYLIFEKSLFNFSGGRSSNIFCVPLHEWMPQVRNELTKLLKEGGVTQMEWDKYFAVNLLPIWGRADESARLGTIEFRHMQGTTNIEYIIEWINLIVSLKITAKKMETADLVHALKTMNTNSSYNDLVNYVFGDWAEYLTKQKTFKQDVEHGVLMAKEVCFPYLPQSKREKFSIEVPFPRSLISCAE